MDVLATGIVDFLILTLFILISFAIGVFYAFKSRNNPSEDEYFLGERKIPLVAASCSAAASAFAGSHVIALPNDSYFRGPGTWFGAILANVFESFFLSIVFVPIFHRLKLTNVYDYLEMRFNVWVKYYAATVQVLYTMFFMAVQIYAPSLALTAVSGLNVNMSIILVGGVCVVYTTIGGMKAVVWNDVFQTFVIAIGTAIMYVVGIPAAGGFKKIFQVTSSAERSLRVDFSFDLTKPYTFWSFITGFPLVTLSRSACGQYNAQRYLVVKTVNEARVTAIFAQMFSIVFVLCYIFLGLLIYTHFAGCDPLANGEVTKEDQVFPHWMVEVLQYHPGVIGVIVCASFSSALSTVSSGINAQTVMTHKMVKKILPFMKNASPEKNIRCTKILTGFLGCAILCFSFLATYIGGIVDSIITWAGILVGLILAVFILGMVSREATSLSALVGMIGATTVCIWLKLGNMYYPRAPSSRPPLFTDQCNVTTSIAMMTSTMMTTTECDLNAYELVDDVSAFESIPLSVYQISSTYYAFIACVGTWSIAFLVTKLTHVAGRIYSKEIWLYEERKNNKDLFLRASDLSFLRRIPQNEEFRKVKRRETGAQVAEACV